MKLLPNVVTILRFVLVGPIGWSLLVGEFEICLWLLVVAGLSDALDGFLARRFSWTSRFGELADPIADKLLAVVVVALMLLTDLLPWWVAAIVVGRELVIVSGALAFRSVVHKLDIEPLTISRINTIVQLTVLCFILAAETEIAGLAVFAEQFVEQIGLYLMVLFTVVSGVAYVYTWSSRLRSYLAESQNQVESSNP